MPFANGDVEDPLEAAFEDVDAKPSEPAAPAAPVTDPSVSQKLDQIQTGQNQNTMLMNLLAMPEVQEVLKMKQQGQQVRVLSGLADPGPVAQNEPEPDWEKFKEDPKLLTDHIIKQLGKDVNASFGKMIGEKLNPIIQKIGEIEGTVVAGKQKEVMTTIEQVKEKYADFDAHRDAMREQNAKSPGLELEDLYLLVKARKGEGPVLRNELQSERPSSAAAKKAIQPTQKKSYPVGRRGFEAALNDALLSQDLQDFLKTD